MRKGLITGTFDPPTLGHLNILERAARLCGHLDVAIGLNSGKVHFFGVEERIEMLQIITQHLDNVSVVVIEGLVSDYAVRHGITCIFRGLRAASDCDYEFSMATANRQMSGVETLFIPSEGSLLHLSSTLIREIAASGKHLEAYLPKQIIQKVYTKFVSPRKAD